MTKMNSNHCSRLAVLLAVCLVAMAATGPAAAISVANEDTPAEVEVGEKVTAAYTMEELYQNPSFESWSIEGETELENVTWTVTYYDQSDEKIDQYTHDGQSFSQSGVDIDSGVSKVRVQVTGEAPAVGNYTYDPEETFTVATLTQVRDGGSSNEIGTWEAHHYTENSKQARNAIDSANAAIEDADGDSEAEDTRDTAVDVYGNGDFDNAIELANRAESEASSSQQRQMLLFGGLGLVGLVALVGGGYVLYQRSRQDSYDKLG